MSGSYHQKRDLLEFGQQVQRLLVQRIITARNAGRITDEQMDLLGELVPQVADVQVLLDNFTPRVNIPSALNELEPCLLGLRTLNRAAVDDNSPYAKPIRSAFSRVEAAIRYLKADPR